ncbi:carboxymuconolactone decarboxylase family protein (plasmid) [Nocardioides sp. R1-1]|uniref:carboxymuconolactone decarboxylase family protein n=1 Tax=Nocardioides sp. R1-1 TaxID=3383502 RepID=UPI0038D04431
MTRIRPASTNVHGRAGDDRAARIADSIGAVFAHRPQAYRAYIEAEQALQASGTLSPRLVELVRLRIAFHNQCRTCMATRRAPDVVSEDLVCSLERPYEAPDLSEEERAALRFADLFAADHLSIDDAEYDKLRAFFSEAELVELGMRCAFFVGFGRLTATWDVVEDLPSSFSQQDFTAPWGHQEVVEFAPFVE